MPITIIRCYVYASLFFVFEPQDLRVLIDGNMPILVVRQRQDAQRKVNAKCHH